MTRRALLVACGSFSDKAAFTELKYAVTDAQRLGKVLRDENSGFFDRVEILENPDDRTVSRALEKISNESTHEDLLLFYFSGHGKLARNQTVCLVTANTELEYLNSTSISSDSLKGYINTSRASGKIIILDCCYGGAFGTDAIKSSDAETPMSIFSNQVRGTHILTASTRFQAAFESDQLEGGILTSCLIRGIENGTPKNASSRQILFSELVEYTQTEVTKYGVQQPQYWVTESGGPLVIAKRRPVYSSDWRFKARKSIAAMETRGSLDPQTADQVRALLSLSEPSEQQLLLVSDLIEKRVGTGVFIKRWTEHGAPSLPVRPTEYVNAKAAGIGVSIPLTDVRSFLEILNSKFPLFFTFFILSSSDTILFTPGSIPFSEAITVLAMVAIYTACSYRIALTRGNFVAKGGFVQRIFRTLVIFFATSVLNILITTLTIILTAFIRVNLNVEYEHPTEVAIMIIIICQYTVFIFLSRWYLLGGRKQLLWGFI